MRIIGLLARDLGCRACSSLGPVNSPRSHRSWMSMIAEAIARIVEASDRTDVEAVHKVGGLPCSHDSKYRLAQPSLRSPMYSKTFPDRLTRLSSPADRMSTATSAPTTVCRLRSCAM